MTSPRTYFLTFAALLILSVLTFVLSFAPLGPAALPAALVIAAAKALLLVTVFMHLREHSSSSRAALLVSIFLAALLIGFVSADVLSRNRPTAAALGF